MDSLLTTLVFVAAKTPEELGEEYWTDWSQRAVTEGSRDLCKWSSSQHFNFNMDLRNIFLNPGSPWLNQTRIFDTCAPDTISDYLCKWLTWSLIHGSATRDDADAFVKANGLPRTLTRFLSLEMTPCSDEEL